MFSHDNLRNDPRNHCVPVLDAFPDEGDNAVTYLVMPLLRPFDDPPFDFVHDIVDFTDQILEVRFVLGHQAFGSCI